MLKIKYLFQSIFFAVFFFNFLFTSCSENSVDYYVSSPETLKKFRVASFFGPQARKNCVTMRRLNAGLCDLSSQPFITCYDIDEKKLEASKCD